MYIKPVLKITKLLNIAYAKKSNWEQNKLEFAFEKFAVPQAFCKLKRHN